MAKVASLWVGGPLNKIQEVCLASFVYYNHETYLYVYDLDMNVPDGVVKLDANTIIPESQIFYYHGQLAAFSDLFRYRMIMDTGMMWVDADVICLTKDFFNEYPFVFIQESETLIAGGILKMPQDHNLTRVINKHTEDLLPQIKQAAEKGEWAVIGPLLLTKLVKKLGLEVYAQPASKVNLLDHWSKGIDFWNPDKTEELLEACEGAFCATAFTGNLRMQGFDVNKKAPEGSAIAILAERFGVKWD